METLSKNQLKEILSKNWMTHDAMWFYHCLRECGIEKMNRINRAAVRAMGIIEIRKIQKAVGIQKVATFEDFGSLIEAAWDIVKGDFMKSSFSLPAKNILQGGFEKCFAYDGIKQIGAIGQYQCGIFERIYGWLDGIGIRYSVSPQVEGCVMHTDGKCFREIRLTFDE